MPLIAEDGTGINGANSFATRAEIISYAAARGVVIADDEASDKFGIEAMDFLNAKCWAGEQVFEATPFPRKGIVEGDLADDYVYSIPLKIKQAQMHLAMEASKGIALLPSRSADAAIKKEKVGVIETEYFGPAGYEPDLPFVAALIASFECGQTGFGIRTFRA